MLITESVNREQNTKDLLEHFHKIHWAFDLDANLSPLGCLLPGTGRGCAMYYLVRYYIQLSKRRKRPNLYWVVMDLPSDLTRLRDILKEEASDRGTEYI